MRSKRTQDEERILSSIAEPLNRLGVFEYEVDEAITDAPDIVLKIRGTRIGIEITRLDYEDFCKWLGHKPGKEYPRKAEVTMDLIKLLGSVANKKWDNYEKYIERCDLAECWLVLHNDLFEMKEKNKEGGFGIKDFEKYSRLILQDLNCPYDRVWFNFSHTNAWYYMYTKKHYIRKSGKVMGWPIIKFGETNFIMKRGENHVDLSKGKVEKEFM